jgi:hypothetical protein
MNEVLPVVAGAVVGAAASRLPSRRLALVATLALSLVIGVGAAALAGELAVSWVFVLVDAAQALIAALLVRALVHAWRQRSARVR